MPPPELARDVPVGRVHERVDGEPVLRVGVVTHAARLQSLDRRRPELVHAAPPLERDQRLDAALAALAECDRVPVGLALDEQAVLERASAVMRRDAETAILVRGDDAAVHGRVMKGIGLLRQAGAKRVIFVLEPLEDQNGR